MRRYLIPSALAVVLLAMIALTSPEQVAVVAYKLALLLCAGLAGLGLDIVAAPYAQPGGYLTGRWSWGAWVEGDANNPVAPGCEWLFVAACARRAVIVAASMLTVGMGL